MKEAITVLLSATKPVIALKWKDSSALTVISHSGTNISGLIILWQKSQMT